MPGWEHPYDLGVQGNSDLDGTLNVEGDVTLQANLVGASSSAFGGGTGGASAPAAANDTTWTPSLTQGTNCDLANGLDGGWMRVGNMVSFYLRVSVSATTASSPMTFEITPPVASTFNDSEDDAFGIFYIFSASRETARIKANTSNNTLEVTFTPDYGSTYNISGMGFYRVK